jgi:PleD family two-component response regulator
MRAQVPIVSVEDTREDRLASKLNFRQSVVLSVSSQPEKILPLAGMLPDHGFEVITVPDENIALEIAAEIPPELVVA